MHYVDRKFVCERLRLSDRVSYRLLPARRMHLISTDDILDLLNEARKGTQETLDYIPSDIRTPEEIETETGIRAHSIKRWCGSTRKRVPHFRINKHTYRLSMKAFTDWFERNNKTKAYYE